MENLIRELYLARRSTAQSVLSDYARPSLINLLKEQGEYVGGGIALHWFGVATPFRYSFKRVKCSACNCFYNKPTL